MRSIGMQEVLTTGPRPPVIHITARSMETSFGAAQRSRKREKDFLDVTMSFKPQSLKTNVCCSVALLRDTENLLLAFKTQQRRSRGGCPHPRTAFGFGFETHSLFHLESSMLADSLLS